MDLIGTSAVVTGAGQGMGRQIARRLMQHGADVLVFELNGDVAARTAQELSAETDGAARAIAHAGSVADTADVDAAFEAATAAFGTPQLLVNNAGVASMSLIVDMPAEDWDLVLDVCAKGPFLCTQAAARRLIAAGLPGAIVNISSINYAAATDGLAHYCAAKAAVSQFTKVAAAELAPSAIRVNAIAPGLTRTPMSEGGFLDGRMGEEFIAHTPMGRFGEPDDIARVAAFLCSEDSGWITGATVPVDGGGHIRGLHNYWATMHEASVA
ncbi:MAG: short-chain dehydrogenase/reductase [Conexibacter sp.]|nr:short-chain dehydrogenase/reductase [Conexibacter sp.]